MGLWSFIRDMFVWDWLFGHHKKVSSWERNQSWGQGYAENYRHDDYNCGYSNYSHNDYAQQDFDDDMDADMYDDDF